MMKVKLIICIFISVFFKTSNEDYSEALNLIISSQEYQSLDVDESDYIVSEEIISFDTFGLLFGIERTQPYELESTSISTIPKAELLKLNKKKCGHAKIFFSEEKQDIFFAEVFYNKRLRMYKYSEKPSFGSSYVYMFRKDNGKITLVKTEKFHYN